MGKKEWSNFIKRSLHSAYKIDVMQLFLSFGWRVSAAMRL